MIGTAADRRKRSRPGPRTAVVHAASLLAAVLLAWYIATGITSRMSFLPASSVLLGGMWTVCATAFVYREQFTDSRSSAASRLIATTVSFVLTMAYFAVFPFTPVGLAVVLSLGALIVDFIGDPGDSVTVSITSAVVMVVAALGPATLAWEQPILRLVETLLGAAVGLATARVTRYLLDPSFIPGQAPSHLPVNETTLAEPTDL